MLDPADGKSLAKLASQESGGKLTFDVPSLTEGSVAADVTLLTRSKLGGSGYRWQSGGDEFYETAPAWREETGTTVESAVAHAPRKVFNK